MLPLIALMGGAGAAAGAGAAGGAAAGGGLLAGGGLMAGGAAMAGGGGLFGGGGMDFMAPQAGAGDIPIGIGDWMSKKHPEIAGNFFEQQGLMDDNKTAVANNTNMSQAGMKPPIPAATMPQLQGMGSGTAAKREQLRKMMQMGLMDPQQPQQGGGLWG